MPQILSYAANAAAASISWVERNSPAVPDLAIQNNDIIVNLARASNQLSSTVHNLKQHPTIGLFGASQAGKSYLVSALAAGQGRSLQTYWDNNAIDFIKHVNPSGNNSEATGFVTRFTHTPHSTPIGFPVELTLLSELEIVMILINAFFNDINQADVKMSPNEHDYLAHLDRCMHWIDEAAQKATLQYREWPDKLTVGIKGTSENQGAIASLNQSYSTDAQSDAFGEIESALSCDVPCAVAGWSLEYARQVSYTVDNQGNAQKVSLTEGNFISYAQVVELADFVELNSNGKLGGAKEFPAFWRRLREMLPFMPLDGRVEALSILWDKQPIFSETYRTLARELLNAQGSKVIYAPIEAFVVPSDNGGLIQQSKGTIMHITKLAEMFREDDVILQCQRRDGTGSHQPMTVSFSRLAALSLELCFCLQSEGSIGNFDVLDLPGARSRDVVLYKDVKDDSVNFVGGVMSDAMQRRGSEFFRRGKVAYLFDRYARRNEIEQLLFCIGVNAQQDVTNVLTILSNWVEKNVGSSPQEREGKYNPLTIVLTRYDEVFNRQLKNINQGLPMDMEQELNIALNRIQKLNWFTTWTPGKPFDRVMLARKPNLGDINPWIDFDPDSKEESRIKDDAVANIEAIKKKLLGVDDFRLYINDFEGCLNAVLTFNDGGVSRIAQEVLKNSRPDYERRYNHTEKAISLIKKCREQLSPFAQFESGIALEKAKREGLQVSLELMQCDNLSKCFYMFRNLLDIPERRLIDIYSSGVSNSSNVNRFVKEVCKAYQDNLTNLGKRDNPALRVIAKRVAKGYERNSKNIKSDAENIQYYSLCYNQSEQRFKEPSEVEEAVVALFNRIANEINITFRSAQIGLQDYMIRRLMEQENINESSRDLVSGQVQLMSLMLSDFNMYLGANLLPSSQSSAAIAAKAVGSMNSMNGANGMNSVSEYGVPETANMYPQGNYGVSSMGSQFGGYGAPMQNPAMLDNGAQFGGYGAAAQNQVLGQNPALMQNPAMSAANQFGGYGATMPNSTVPNSAMLANNGSQFGGYGVQDNGGDYGQNMSQAYSAQAVHSENLSGQNVVYSVLGSSDGPCNHFSHNKDRSRIYYNPNQRKDYGLFRLANDVDDTRLLPHLNEASGDYEFKLISDFCSVLMYMMCHVNILQDSKYKLPSQENSLLCKLLEIMKECESCQA